MKRLLTPLLALLALLVFFSCGKEKVETTAPMPRLDDSKYYTPTLESLSAFTSDRSACNWTEIPAGSVNALAAAIAGACNDGVIYLKAGLHTENSRIVVNKPLKIIGEPGAILRVSSPVPNPYPAAGTPLPLPPGLHILNAPGTLLQNVDVQPVGADGSMAVLIENSPGSAVLKSKFTNFQFAVMVEKSDRVAIIGNFVHATSLWRTGAVADAYSIVVMNGKSCYVADNEVENSLFGIWACDRWGTCERNNCHSNMVGIILCKVPASLQLPSGQVVGAEFPATQWKTGHNTAVGNFDNGIMVIDGSTGNYVFNNNAHGNGLAPLAGTAADIEVFGDSQLFGFLTPVTTDNWIDASQYPATTIKNCGLRTTVVGGTMMNGGCR